MFLLKVKTYLIKSGIQVLDWPGNSFELNPIENCWHIIQPKITAKKPATKIELQKSILRIWFHDIGQD